MDFIQLMNSAEYDFLREHHRLGKRIILMGLGGSHAYGTENENSDIDFRGITLNLPSDLLGLTEFEQYEDENTDTVIYSFNKIVKLLLECNPNTIEILGLDEDQYLIKTTDEWQAIYNIAQQYFSRKAKSAEKDLNPKLSAIQMYIENEIVRYGQISKNMDDDRTSDWEALNVAFLKSLEGNKGLA